MAEQRAPVLLALHEVRDLVTACRNELVRQGDDVQVIRERVDELAAEVGRLAELEERRSELERLASTEEVEERRARVAEELERRRWVRTTLAERLLVPLLSALVGLVLGRLSDLQTVGTDPPPTDPPPTAAEVPNANRPQKP